MTTNLQYLFKSPNSSPGPNGTEICVDKRLTEYSKELGLKFYVVQLWEGNDEDTQLINYIVIDPEQKIQIFSDPRSQVIEYILENISNNQQTDVESS